jgi:tetratricopeptide (TPR) repeat protein
MAGTLGARRTAAALLVALLPAACGSGDGMPAVQQAEAVQAGAGAGGQSLVGNYLAGRHAQSQRDISAAADFLNTVLEKDPANRDLLHSVFLLSAIEGRIADSLTLARRVTGMEGDTPIANLALVVDDIKNARFYAAEARLDKTTTKGVNVFMRPLMRAWTLVGLGRVDDGLKALNPLTEKSGYKAMYDLHAALINERAERLEAAEKNYKSTAASGLSLRIVELLGALYRRTGRVQDAEALYKQYQGEHPTSQLLEASMARLRAKSGTKRLIASEADGVAEALFGVASSLRTQNARETALIFGHLALYLKPDFPLTQILIADILESEDRLENANAIYETIAPGSEFSWSARLRVAGNLDRLDRHEEAMSRLRVLAGEDPANAEPFINLGDILRRRERYGEAVVAYGEAVARIGKLGRRHWSLLYSRGIALERAKNWPAAEADFLKALEFVPKQPYVLNYLGYSWVDQGHNLEKARKMIETAVSLRPNDGYIVDSLGWALYRMEDFEKASRELERAVELRPEDPIINDHLGDAYWKVGRRAEARFQWKRALSLEPEDGLVAGIKAKIERGIAEKAEAATGGND